MSISELFIIKYIIKYIQPTNPFLREYDFWVSACSTFKIYCRATDILSTAKYVARWKS